MIITFLGAAGTVTGSKYLLEIAGRKILVDCGLFQGIKKLRLRNREPFPVDPATIDAVVLTHAHLDHTGYLPLLVRNGFAGPVYSTAATGELCGILLPDAGHLQEEEAEHANRHGYSKHKPAEPLYTEAEARASLEQFRDVAFGEPIEVAEGITAEFQPAGHLLGAAIVRITAEGRAIVFSGDLGRPSDPMLPAPARIDRSDYLVVESTYGDRRHTEGDPMGHLARVIGETAARGGVILIPSFAVGRAQLLLHYLDRLIAERRIPELPIYLDSPMASKATRAFAGHAADLRLSAEACERACSLPTITESVEESKEIGRMAFPRIIISASGMATGGRVLHHLKNFAPDPRNTILFAGYQAVGTRGASIVGGAESVKIHGKWVPIRASVEQIDNLSAHADYVEILDWLSGFDEPPRRTFITHGEPAAADALRLRIEDQLHWNVAVPEHGERAELG